MTPHDDHSLYARIDATLAAIVVTLPAPPDWFGRWRDLGPDSSDEERLGVYQAIRDSGLLPDDAGFYLVSWQADALIDQVAERELQHLDDRLRAIEEAHGLGEDEIWDPDEAPAEYRQVVREYHDAWDAIFAEQLKAFGEDEIAELFLNDREEYLRRSEAGRHYFHGPLHSGDEDGDDWLDALLDAVTDCVEPESPMGPLGLLYREEEGYWEVDIYPTPVELVGGADDGAIVMPNFCLDLEELRASFERVDDAGWNAFGWPGGEGSFVWIEGVFASHEVWLRVMAQAPEGEEPGAKLRIKRRDPDG